MSIQPKSFFLGAGVGLGLALAVRFLPALALGGLASLLAPSIHVETEQVVPSPDGSRVAVVQIRDGGATTAASRHVAIAPAGGPFPEVGNVFRARGSGHVSVSWTGDREILVESEAEARYFDAQAEGVWATLRLRGPSGRFAEESRAGEEP